MQKLTYVLLSFFLLLSVEPLLAQQTYWQQKADYQMKVNFDHKNHQLTGEQAITYFNNSPDSLTEVFYHLFFNAFQPGSMMDVKSKTISDPDRRVGNRIAALTDSEIGYTDILSLKMNGQDCQFETRETILVVKLPKPIKPGAKVKFDLTWKGQVPIQIRRSGRFNREGVHYTMTQWFPKICEYDYDGWHAHQYVGREFQGVFGDYDVEINIDSVYTLAGTGVVQNPNEVGKGYQSEGSKVKKYTSDKLTWKFKAENVIDFAWAADPNYIHDTYQMPNGPLFRFFYHEKNANNWSALPAHMEKVFTLMAKYFGKYPYPEYSIISGGDGGMEYPMCTMILGGGSLEGLLGVSTHEAIHSWYQAVLATNEAMYPWMDEGFTSFAEDMVLDSIYNKNSFNAHLKSYGAYFSLVESGKQEPPTTHGDHYNVNRAYSITSYYKGQIFLNQLSYIVGNDAFFKGMMNYWNEWQFKHPNPRDFKRVMERATGFELDWYIEYWVQTTKTIDYGISSVFSVGEGTYVILDNEGEMPMPVDLIVKLKNGQTINYYIPSNLQFKSKSENIYDVTIEKKPWPFTHKQYILSIEYPLLEIDYIEIDPTQRMADKNRVNNTFPPSTDNVFLGDYE